MSETGQERRFSREKGPLSGQERNPDALDLEPGGAALCDSPFRLGRLGMLAREESIYRASGMRLSSAETKSPAAGQDQDKRALIADLLASQEEEGALFKDLLAAALDLSLPGGDAVPGVLSPERLDLRLARYIAFALRQDSPRQASSPSDLSGR
ncbi:MAG: hypothetical protein LBP61_09275, partial [Desulfovibrio sp.]|nr:hypothetical protein [Desulfovibrio sp.]